MAKAAAGTKPVAWASNVAIGKTYEKGRVVESVRLSGIHGVHDINIPGGYAPPERRAVRDMSKAGIKVEEPQGGFRDDEERLRKWGLIP